MKVTVLGCGLVGSAIVRDLSKEPDLDVTAVDVSERALAKALEGIDAKAVVDDLSRPGSAARHAEGQDLVVGAVPGSMGLRVLSEVIGAGRPVVDISFMPEDPYRLDDLAKERGVTAVVDCGVAPGTSGLLVGRAAAEMDEVTLVRILVGGLPVQRSLPWEYAAVFSPADVIEEYTRPARVVEGGGEVVKPPMTERELVEFPGVGTLEAFLTDGLRTLIRNVPARTMCEKTMRYPGHCDRIRFLRDAGFLGEEPVEVGGHRLSPRAMTERLLIGQWRMLEGTADLTAMRVEVEGTRGGARARHRYDLLDRFDDATRTTSMARTTGYACTAAVRLVLDGRIAGKGVLPAETFGGDRGVADAFLAHLEARGVRVTAQIE